MPVLPLVGSMMRAPGASCASSSIAFATRSLIEPVGFWPSSFAYMRTDGVGASRCSSTSGVFPIRSSSEPAALATRHRGQQDHCRGLVDGRLESVARAHVLALDVDVHERRDAAVVEDA